MARSTKTARSSATPRDAYLVSAGFGIRSADAVVTLTPRDVRRTTTVVGRLPRTAFYSSEVWVHPDGKHAYLGTTLGGDRIYAIDISDPSKPRHHGFDRGQFALDERRDDDGRREVDGLHA